MIDEVAGFSGLGELDGDSAVDGVAGGVAVLGGGGVKRNCHLGNSKGAVW